MRVVARKGKRPRRPAPKPPRFELIEVGKGYWDWNGVWHPARRSGKEQPYRWRLIDRHLARTVAYYSKKWIANRDLKRRGINPEGKQ